MRTSSLIWNCWAVRATCALKNTCCPCKRPLALPMRLAPNDWGYTWAVNCLHAAEEFNKLKDVGYELCIKGELLLFLAALVGRSGDLPPADTPDTRRLKTVVQLVNEQYAGALHVTDAAAACGCSPSHFMRWFKKMTGQGFTEYLNEHRLNAAADALRSSNDTILAIAEQCGFDNLSYFNRLFKKKIWLDTEGIPGEEIKKPPASTRCRR